MAKYRGEIIAKCRGEIMAKCRGEIMAKCRGEKTNWKILLEKTTAGHFFVTSGLKKDMSY